MNEGPIVPVPAPAPAATRRSPGLVALVMLTFFQLIFRFAGPAMDAISGSTLAVVTWKSGPSGSR
ncbi:MAG: hypothetical protein HGA24_05390 [Candidatus Aminicenantes bacterium]|nr:hypothetical protein [Candidatus Aminicenantes bacterium]